MFLLLKKLGAAAFEAAAPNLRFNLQVQSGSDKPLGAQTTHGDEGQDVQQDAADVSHGDGELQVILRLNLGLGKSPSNTGLGDAGDDVDGDVGD